MWLDLDFRFLDGGGILSNDNITSLDGINHIQALPCGQVGLHAERVLCLWDIVRYVRGELGTDGLAWFLTVTNWYSRSGLPPMSPSSVEVEIA